MGGDGSGGSDDQNAMQMRMSTANRDPTVKARLSIKVDEESKQPLLAASDREDEDENEERKNDVIAMLSSPRVAARKNSLAGSMDANNMRRRTTNVLKTVDEKVDKFENKAEKLKQQREAEEQAQRQLEIQREKDA